MKPKLSYFENINFSNTAAEMSEDDFTNNKIVLQEVHDESSVIENASESENGICNFLLRLHTHICMYP